MGGSFYPKRASVSTLSLGDGALYCANAVSIQATLFHQAKPLAIWQYNMYYQTHSAYSEVLRSFVARRVVFGAEMGTFVPFRVRASPYDWRGPRKSVVGSVIGLTEAD